MLSGNERRPLRNCLARAFDHSAMKQAATAFTVANMSPELTLGFNQEQVQPALVDVANAFIELQEARHDADYNRFRRLTRREALDLADQAFQDWNEVRGSLQADTFLTGLLAYKHMRG